MPQALGRLDRIHQNAAETSLYHYIRIAAPDKDMPGCKGYQTINFNHVQRTNAVETFCEGCGEARGHMLSDDDGIGIIDR